MLVNQPDALASLGHMLDDSTQVIREKRRMQCLSGMVGGGMCCIGKHCYMNVILHLHLVPRYHALSPSSFLIAPHVEEGQTCLENKVRLALEHLCGTCLPYTIRR